MRVRYYRHPSGTGQGDAAERYVDALRAAGVPVDVTPLAWNGRTMAPVPDADDPVTGADTVVVHSTPIWHAAWSGPARPRRLVAYTTFEADRLPVRWVPLLDRYDAVLVPTERDRDVFRASGVRAPLSVVPHVARPPSPAPDDGLGLAASTFLVAVIGTWSARKAVPDSVRAFLDAFSAADDVALMLKTSTQDRVATLRRGAGAVRAEGQAWWSLAQLLAGRPDPPTVRLVTRDLSRSEVDALHVRADCHLGLSHGEGWGLGAFDAAAAGTPAVVTGWGGSLAWLPAGYPYLVDAELVDTTSGERDDWFEAEPGQRWARADLAHATRLLRQVYTSRETAQAWGRRLQEHVMRRYSPEAVTPALLAALGI